MPKTLPMIDMSAPVCCAPVAAGPMSDDDALHVALRLKALADPARVKILNLIARSDEPACVCELIPAVGLSQPTVSHHLKKLTEAGLLAREQRGTWAFYSVDPEAAGRLAALADLKGGTR